MKHITKTRPSMLVDALAIAFGAHAAEITIVNFGGVNGNAQKAAFNKPFEAQIGNKVTVVEYNGEQAKIKAMVEAKHVSWDVMEVESGDIGRGCDEGLFGKLDWSKIAKKTGLIPGAPQICDVGFFVWSIALAYSADKLKTAPKGWADFWDVKTFLGKRGMCKGARYNLEFALMADGVSVKDVYKVLAIKDGQNRVLKKSNQPKSNTQQWETGAQPPQFLVVGDVAMSIVLNGRIGAVQREGKNLKVVWGGSIYDLDYWAILRGSPNKVLAEQYIAYMLSQKSQQEHAKHIAYGSANVATIKALDVKTQTNTPNSPENSKNVVLQNLQLWTDHGDESEQRFTSRASKQAYSGVT